jgi:hypothetical protein
MRCRLATAVRASCVRRVQLVIKQSLARGASAFQFHPFEGSRTNCKMRRRLTYIEYARLEAEKVTAARANPNDPPTFPVTLKAPPGASGTLHLMSGRQVSVLSDGLVAVSLEDATPLLSIGWARICDLSPN